MTLAPNPKKHLSHLPVDCEHGGLGEPQSPGPNQADTSTPSAFVLGLAVDIFFKKQKLLPIIHQLGQLCCLINPLRSSHQNYKTCAGHLSPGVSPNLGGIVLESTAAMKQKPVTPPFLPPSWVCPLPGLGTAPRCTDPLQQLESDCRVLYKIATDITQILRFCGSIPEL